MKVRILISYPLYHGTNQIGGKVAQTQLINITKFQPLLSNYRRFRYTLSRSAVDATSTAYCPSNVYFFILYRKKAVPLLEAELPSDLEEPHASLVVEKWRDADVALDDYRWVMYAAGWRLHILYGSLELECEGFHVVDRFFFYSSLWNNIELQFVTHPLLSCADATY